MKGLLTKDLLILKQQAKTAVFILLCGIMMSFTFEKTMVIGYITIIGTMLAFSTIGYDEFDNGYSFIFTLPVSRRTYVREKYALALGCAFSMAVLGGIIALVMMLADGTQHAFEETLISSGSMIAVAILFISFMIPVRIKYNAEKGRVIMYILYAAVLVAGFAGSKLISMLGIDMPGFIAKLDAMNPWVIMCILAIAVLILLAVSEQYTEHVISKKEY